MQEGLKAEIREFHARKENEQRKARMRITLWKALGIDPASDSREAGLRRLARLIRRERLRGLCRPWEYDLDYHIALKQALRALSAARERA
jgi:hypothetical protein